MKKPINLSKYKIYWPYFLFAIFAIVILVNVGYIFIAEKTWRGIYTPSSYKKTSDYNKILEKIQEQRKLGLLVRNNIININNQDYFIESNLVDLNNNLVIGIEVIYKLKYLPDSKYDFDIAGEISAKTFSSANIKLQQPGTWELETVVSHNNKIIQDIHYIIVKPKPSS